MPVSRKILIVSYAGAGHINPSLTFADRLRKMGVDVTISTSFFVLKNIKDKDTTPPGLTFAPFSDGHDNGIQPTTTLQQFISDFATNGARSVGETITSAVAAGQPFDHLVYTSGIPWAAKVAQAHKLKSSLLWCQPATVLNIHYYYFNGYENLIADNMNNASFPIELPGLPSLTTADLPSFYSPSRPKEHEFLMQVLEDHVDALKTAPRVLVTSFNELEIESITASEQLEFLPIGPLIRSDGKENDECIKWLDTKLEASVVYVAFGSQAILSMEQVEEIATGLVTSNRPFLWVIRDSEQARRVSKTAQLQTQGMIVEWCSQVAVLNHRSIGCFVTHGGWNSTIEALVASVPAVVFPQWAGQPTNAKMIEDVWKTGVRVTRRGDGVVDGKEIDRCLQKVMTGDDSGEMRRNACKWRNLATEALENGGSSTVNLQAFVNDL
ncbi:putative crocetin glucosyltransferase [Helianthus debilis subsp. tardiflorus]